MTRVPFSQLNADSNLEMGSKKIVNSDGIEVTEEGVGGDIISFKVSSVVPKKLQAVYNGDPISLIDLATKKIDVTVLSDLLALLFDTAAPTSNNTYLKFSSGTLSWASIGSTAGGVINSGENATTGTSTNPIGIFKEVGGDKLKFKSLVGLGAVQLSVDNTNTDIFIKLTGPETIAGTYKGLLKGFNVEAANILSEMARVIDANSAQTTGISPVNPSTTLSVANKNSVIVVESNQVSALILPHIDSLEEGDYFKVVMGGDNFTGTLTVNSLGGAFLPTISSRGLIGQPTGSYIDFETNRTIEPTVTSGSSNLGATINKKKYGLMRKIASFSEGGSSQNSTAYALESYLLQSFTVYVHKSLAGVKRFICTDIIYDVHLERYVP